MKGCFWRLFRRAGSTSLPSRPPLVDASGESTACVVGARFACAGGPKQEFRATYGFKDFKVQGSLRFKDR